MLIDLFFTRINLFTMNIRCNIRTVLLLIGSWLFLTSASFGQGSISGTITDNNDNPITGATIIIEALSIL